MEVGFVDVEGKRPEDKYLEVTKTIKEDRNPIWNTQFLLNQREDEDQEEAKFLYAGVVDNSYTDQTHFLDQLWIPIEELRPFMPYNFLFHSKSYEFKKQGHFYMSIVKEEIDTESTTDEYANIVVHETIFDPMPSPKIKRFWILMTQYNFSPKEIE